MDISYIVVMMILVLLSGYFSATETAFSSLNKIKIKALLDKDGKRNKKAELVLKLSEDYNTLIEAIKAQGLAESSYQWYTDLRKYGSVPHAGFGLGIERSVAWICGLPHVRETGAFPRLPRRLKP